MSTNNPSMQQKESICNGSSYPLNVQSFVPFALSQQQLYLQRQQQQQQQQSQLQLEQRQNKFKLSNFNLAQQQSNDYASNEDDDVFNLLKNLFALFNQ